MHRNVNRLSGNMKHEIAAAFALDPVLELRLEPTAKLERFERGAGGFGIGARQEEQRLDDAPEPHCVATKLVENALVFGNGSRPAPGNIDSRDQAGQRRAKLVRCLTRELLLPLERFVQPVEYRVELGRELLELVPRPRAGQA